MCSIPYRESPISNPTKGQHSPSATILWRCALICNGKACNECCQGCHVRLESWSSASDSNGPSIVYSMAKQIRWSWPDTMGEDKYIVMLGGLHTEMAVLNILCEWLDGSGWTTALTEASITRSGKAEALISASHVKCSRYAHQVSLATLHELRLKSYEMDMLFDDTDNPPDFPSWCKRKAEQCPQFQFWSITMCLESTLLLFVRSQCESNFFLYIDTLGRLMPWFFALDHVHYARWLPVHMHDLWALQQSHPDVHREFMKGKFVIQRSSHAFSLMPMDQSHEQTNKIIKGEGRAVGLTENASALKRWMLAGPEVTRVVNEFETLMPEYILSNEHHEKAHHVQESFSGQTTGCTWWNGQPLSRGQRWIADLRQQRYQRCQCDSHCEDYWTPRRWAVQNIR